MNATTLRDRIRSRIAGRKALRASPRAAGLSEEQAAARLYDERNGSSSMEAARRELALLKRFRGRRRREP
jgi:hypothetical protein